MIILSNSLTLSGDVEKMPLIGWHNIVTSGNISSNTEDEDFPVVNLSNPATHLKWVGGINTFSEEYVTVEIDFAGEIDYVGIAKHNFSSEGINVSVEAHTSGNSPDVWLEIVQQTLPTDDAPLILRFVPSSSYDRVRVRLSSGTTGAIPEMAVLYIGKMLVMERSIKVDVDHVPVSLARKTSVVSGMSESGNFIGRNVLNQYQETQAEFAWIDQTWYRANFDPFVLQAKDTPFFWAWAPDDYQTDVGYCWLTADPMPAIHPVTRMIEVSLEMRGVT